MIACTQTDILLFGRKTCSHCGRTLARCADFFGEDANNPDGFTSACLACRAEMHADRQQQRIDLREYERRDWLELDLGGAA